MEQRQKCTFWRHLAIGAPLRLVCNIKVGDVKAQLGLTLLKLSLAGFDYACLYWGQGSMSISNQPDPALICLCTIDSLQLSRHRSSLARYRRANSLGPNLHQSIDLYITRDSNPASDRQIELGAWPPANTCCSTFLIFAASPPSLPFVSSYSATLQPVNRAQGSWSTSASIIVFCFLRDHSLLHFSFRLPCKDCNCGSALEYRAATNI